MPVGNVLVKPPVSAPVITPPRCARTGGGLNLYGYAQGDPINGSDPFGLKVCFKGSRNEVNELREGTERAVGGHITRDDNNCVSTFSVDPEKRGYGELQAGFLSLVDAEAIYSVQFGAEESRFYSSFNPNTRTATILRGDYRGGFYYSGNRITCALFGGHRSAPHSLPGLIVHELIGHGTRGGSEPGARRIENLYHRAAGEPLRCLGG